MAWVVGLIIPILLPCALGEPEVAVGARRDPAGIGIGGRDGELGDGVGRRVDHPDLVGCRLGEPEVAVGARRDPAGTGIGGRNGELGDGDRQQATIFQPFEPGPCPDPVGGAAAGAGGEQAARGLQRKVRRSPRAAVPGCVFDGVMRKLLSWVGVRENHGAHTDRPGRQWPARLLRFGGSRSSRPRPGRFLEPRRASVRFFVSAGFADFVTGSFLRHSAALSFWPVARRVAPAVRWLRSGGPCLVAESSPRAASSPRSRPGAAARPRRTSSGPAGCRRAWTSC